MRLICGILRLDGQTAKAQTLTAMAGAMTQPAQKPLLEIRLDGPMGLAVLDFGGTRGGLSERDGWVIAADARLDEYRPDTGTAFSDAVRQHGADFPDRVHGDFAVALWRSDRSELRLGRDFIGARPLVWTWQAGRWFAFASLPKALHATGVASDAVAPLALATKLTQSYFTGADSGFAEIAYLEAGHSLKVVPKDLTPPLPHRAYRPDPAAVGSWRGSPEEAAETLSDLLCRATAARMESTGGVSCHLSGGLDSSAITLLAVREARRRNGWVLAVSKSTPTALGPAELDERPLIADVLSMAPDLRHLWVEDVLPVPDLPEDSDWPGGFVGGSDEQMAAAAAGTARLLSGVGGDEGASYNGANLYATMLREGRLRILWQELRARARVDGVSFPAAIRARLVAPLAPESWRRFLQRRRGWPSIRDRREGVTRFLNLGMVEEVMPRRFPLVMRTNSPADRVRAFADHHIPSRCAYFSILAARHGLSVSFPLLDRRVVDFVLSLPVQLFLADGQSRQPFRRAMIGILPERVRLATKKVGLIDDRFVRYSARRAELLDTLETVRASASPAVNEIFDLDAVRAALELLPQPDQAARFVRARAGSWPGGHPPWLIFGAVHCLIAARRLSQRSSSTATLL